MGHLRYKCWGNLTPGEGGGRLTDAAGVYAYFSSDRSGARPNDDVIVTSGVHVSCVFCQVFDLKVEQNKRFES